MTDYTHRTGRGVVGDMLRVLVPLAFKVLILILISVHDLFQRWSE